MIIAFDVGITIVNRELLCEIWHIIITTWWCVYYPKPGNVKEWSSWLQKYSKIIDLILGSYKYNIKLEQENHSPLKIFNLRVNQ